MIGYDYDALDRLTIKYMPAPFQSVRYAYDLRGLQVAAWFPGSGWGIVNSYDGFGRLKSTVTNMGGFSRTVAHKYDYDGRETELAFPDDQKFWTARDPLGRMGAVYQGAFGSTTTIMVAFAYNAASQRSYFARRFGDATSYGYDGAGRLAAQEDGLGGALGYNRSTYLYNPAGQLSSESRTNDSYAWQAPASYSRDYAQANGLNQYTGTVSNGTPTATFSYDANGNLLSDGTRTYTYDAENRLITAVGPNGWAVLDYDPLGRLFQINGNGALTQFLYDGDELIAEYNGSGTLLRRYIHGDSDDDPLFWYEGVGLDQPRFPHANHQGSITGIAGPGAALIAINTYDEYGIPGAGNVGRFGYTGQVWIPELGLWYYKARFYSPTLGRFLQTDPVGYKDQINLYAYVGNDPLNHTDPTGMQTSFELAAQRDSEAFLSDEISADDLKARQQARATGGAIGGAIVVAGALITRGFGIPAALAARMMTRAKVFNYLLSPATRDGASKAAWFNRALGFSQKNGGALVRQIKFDPRAASLQKTTQYGKVYTQTTQVVGANGRKGSFTAVWQIDAQGKAAGAPRLITAKDFKIIP